MQVKVIDTILFYFQFFTVIYQYLNLAKPLCLEVILLTLNIKTQKAYKINHKWI